MKKKIGFSPDHADAAALTFAAKVTPRFAFGLPYKPQNRYTAGTETDILRDLSGGKPDNYDVWRI